MMQVPPRSRRSIVIFAVACVTTLNVGCTQPDFINSVNSAADANNQVFEESLVGTWEASIKDEPDILVTVTRQSENSNGYAVKMHSPNGEKDDEEWFGSMRLIKIGDHQFIELETAIPEDAAPEERMTVNGKPIRAMYEVLRITHETDTLAVWGFADRHIAKGLPMSEMIPEVSQGKNTTIVTCSTDQLQKFLLENGGKMSKKAEDFKRLK